MQDYRPNKRLHSQRSITASDGSINAHSAKRYKQESHREEKVATKRDTYVDALKKAMALLSHKEVQKDALHGLVRGLDDRGIGDVRVVWEQEGLLKDLQHVCDTNLTAFVETLLVEKPLFQILFNPHLFKLMGQGGREKIERRENWLRRKAQAIDQPNVKDKYDQVLVVFFAVIAEDMLFHDLAQFCNPHAIPKQLPDEVEGRLVHIFSHLLPPKRSEFDNPIRLYRGAIIRLVCQQYFFRHTGEEKARHDEVVAQAVDPRVRELPPPSRDHNRQVSCSLIGYLRGTVSLGELKQQVGDNPNDYRHKDFRHWNSEILPQFRVIFITNPHKTILDITQAGVLCLFIDHAFERLLDDKNIKEFFYKEIEDINKNEHPRLNKFDRFAALVFAISLHKEFTSNTYWNKDDAARKYYERQKERSGTKVSSQRIPENILIAFIKQKNHFYSFKEIDGKSAAFYSLTYAFLEPLLSMTDAATRILGHKATSANLDKDSHRSATGSATAAMPKKSPADPLQSTEKKRAKTDKVLPPGRPAALASAEIKRKDEGDPQKVLTVYLTKAELEADEVKQAEALFEQIDWREFKLWSPGGALRTLVADPRVNLKSLFDRLFRAGGCHVISDSFAYAIQEESNAASIRLNYLAEQFSHSAGSDRFSHFVHTILVVYAQFFLMGMSSDYLKGSQDELPPLMLWQMDTDFSIFFPDFCKNVYPHIKTTLKKEIMALHTRINSPATTPSLGEAAVTTPPVLPHPSDYSDVFSYHYSPTPAFALINLGTNEVLATAGALPGMPYVLGDDVLELTPVVPVATAVVAAAMTGHPADFHDSEGMVLPMPYEVPLHADAGEQFLPATTDQYVVSPQRAWLPQPASDYRSGALMGPGGPGFSYRETHHSGSRTTHYEAPMSLAQQSSAFGVHAAAVAPPISAAAPPVADASQIAAGQLLKR